MVKNTYNLKTGMFLIATPEIDEGLFYRSVVLLCSYGSEGALGIIVNKPLEVEMEELVAISGDGPYSVSTRAGGPNQVDKTLLLQNRGYGSSNSIAVCPGIYLNGDIIDDSDPPENTLICFGYGGWTCDTLEQEVTNNLWIIHPASQKHLFHTPPEMLWKNLLREMGGDYTILSLMPEADELNLN